MEMIEASAADSWTRDIQVWLNNEDITNDCFYALIPEQDTIESDGIVGIYLRNDNDQRYLVDVYGDKVAALEYIHGRVKWNYKKK